MRWRNFWNRDKEDHAWREEIESYVAIETDENIARGMTPESAAEAARRKFGNGTLVREEIYRMNSIGVVDTLVRGVRQSLRTMRHNPVFAATALLTLALGIGANTAVFSVVNSVLLKPLPYPDAGRLVSVRNLAPGAPGLATIQGALPLSGAMYFTYAEQNRVFSSMGVWNSASIAVTGIAEPEQAPAVFVSEGVLEALAVPPAAGRWLNSGDQVPGSGRRVLLGYDYWQRRFGGDPAVVGRSIQLDSAAAQIVGVMPRGFRIGTTEADLIVPVAFNRPTLTLSGFGFDGVARLKPGMTIEQASADIARLYPVWQQSWPHPNPAVYDTWKITPLVLPLKDRITGDLGAVLWVLMATIGMVMLIACANVANLLLVRAEARQRELSIRAALGAGRGQIARELLLESLTLGVIGGALGVGFAWGAVRVLLRFAPENLPRLDEIALDWRALGFAFGVSLLSGVLFGLAPVLRHAGARALIGLREGGRSASDGRVRNRARNVLVVAQVALALVLLVSSGLMIRTFQALRDVHPGFTNPEQLQTLAINIPQALVPEADRTLRTQMDIVSALTAIPGVESAAFASNLPLDGRIRGWDAIFAQGRELRPDDLPALRHFKSISPGLFAAEGTRFIAGRDFTWTEQIERRKVAVISENLAREEWGSAQAAIGKRFTLPFRPDLWEVIGVVEGVRYGALDEPASAVVYFPAISDATGTLRFAAFVVRTPRAGTASLIEEAQRATASVNPNLTISIVQTMGDVYRRSLARTSFTLVMLAIAGGMALVLGVIGIYGVIAYTVSQRRREIGIRLALGAQPGAVQRRFVVGGLAVVAIGVAIGLGAAAGLSRWMAALLYGVSPVDPVTYGSVAALLCAVAALASWIPARRASKVDPVETLRAD